MRRRSAFALLLPQQNMELRPADREAITSPMSAEFSRSPASDSPVRRPMAWATSPDIIYGSGAAPDLARPETLLRHTFRKLYHRGFGNDDADRYGPVFEMVKDLHREIEAFELRRNENAAEPVTA